MRIFRSSGKCAKSDVAVRCVEDFGTAGSLEKAPIPTMPASKDAYGAMAWLCGKTIAFRNDLYCAKGHR